MSWRQALRDLPDNIATVLDAKALEIRERTAEHGLTRFREGFQAGYIQAATEAGIYIAGGSPLCGYLGSCKLTEGHDGHHFI